jgi:branched-chain amino acid transport system ATP-binding protein
MLEVNGLGAWYGRTQALFDVSFELRKGACLALIGTNGAGKTTTIRAILGLVRTAGTIRFDGAVISTLPTATRVRRHGIGVIHEGRGLFPQMTVRENILVGQSRERHARLDEALAIFPALSNRLDEPVALLSGGQQQMVAMSRIIVQQPQLLLLDEPSLGLAPSVVDEIYFYLARLRESGLTMLLVEQSVSRASAFADELCLIRTGYSVKTLKSSDRAEVDQLVQLAFGGEDKASQETGERA